MSSDARVYTGFWINQSGNPITGATLTLENGAYLVAFLAMLVRTAGRHFWQLLCFALFRAHSRKESQMERPTRQQLAVLRNSSSAMDGLVSFIQIALRSRNGNRKTLYASLSLAATSTINILAFVLAAIFSSRVTQTQSNILLVPSKCGAWKVEKLHSAGDWNQDTFVHSMMLDSIIHRNMWAASQESSFFSNTSQCGQGYGPSGICSIPFTTRNIMCPFGSAVCLQNSFGFEMDTGFVDSYTGLGINTAEEGRVAFRKKLQCAPLLTDGYTKVFSASDDGSGGAVSKNNPFTGYHYGHNLRLGTNYTFAFNPGAFQISRGTAVQRPSYQIGYVDLRSRVFI